MGKRSRPRKGHQDVTRPRGPRGRIAERCEVGRGPSPTPEARRGKRGGGRFTSGGKTKRRRQVQSPDERPEVSRSPAEEGS